MPFIVVCNSGGGEINRNLRRRTGEIRPQGKGEMENETENPKRKRTSLTVLQPGDLASNLSWPPRAIIRKNLQAIQEAVAAGAYLKDVYELLRSQLGMHCSYGHFLQVLRREKKRQGGAAAAPAPIPPAPRGGEGGGTWTLESDMGSVTISLK